jgi:hypothetical protein
MLNNKHQNSSCRFAEEIVSYIYGESSASEKIDFETHLQNCASCADELADFAFVRSSISEWRAEEFLQMETPAIAIPLMKTADSVETTQVSTEKRPWFAALVEMFSLSPMRATAAAAFAVLAICAGIAIWAFNFSDEKVIVDKGNLNISPSPTVPANKNNDIAQKDGTSSKDKDSTKKQSENDKQTTESNTSDEKVVQIKDSVNKKGQSNSPKTDANVPNRKLNDNKNSDKQNKETDKSLPDLSPMTDDEDETLRLTDLFDEIDTED